MKFFLVIIIFLSGLSNLVAQNFNVILQVNDTNLFGNIGNPHITNIENNKSKIYPNYYPGDLIIENFEDINEVFYLCFDYYTYKNNRQKIKNFKVKLTKQLLENPYLIINIYDFRNRKYKRWFQYLTKEDYLVQLTFPNSGLYVRKK